MARIGSITSAEHHDRSSYKQSVRSLPDSTWSGHWTVAHARSPDRPHPIDIHRVRILEIAGGCRLRVNELEALDGTPIVDLKPVLDPTEEG